MKNQFFYTAESGGKQVMASFNVRKVIRSLEIENGSLVVILDDFHDESKQNVKPNANGKPIVVMEKVVLQSEIVLNEEDKQRFKAYTEVCNSSLIDFKELKVK